MSLATPDIENGTQRPFEHVLGRRDRPRRPTRQWYRRDHPPFRITVPSVEIRAVVLLDGMDHKMAE
jgi:hypothetical protein